MLKYLLPLVLLGFTACDLNEEDILKSITGEAEAVPEGTYESQCVLNQDESGYSKFTIEMGAESYTIQEDTYTDVACSEGESLGSPSEAMSVSLPGPDLGSGFSVFTDSDDKKVPYYYKDGELILGEPQEGLPSGEDDFSGFKEDLENGVLAVYQLQPSSE